MKTLAIILCLLSLTGCAYMHDRVRDTCDVVTIAAETGHVNASIQIGEGTLGIGVTGGKGIGSRSGALGIYDYMELNMILFGRKVMLPSERDLLRGKGYDHSFNWYPWRSSEDDVVTEVDEGGRFNLLQLELAACLGIGARIGVNFAELVDFGLGIFTVDILEDDLATIEKREQEAHERSKTEKRQNSGELFKQ